MGPVRHFCLLILLLLGACTLRDTMDHFLPEADRAFALEMVSQLSKGDQAWLERHFEPQQWAQSRHRLAAVPGLFPRGGGRSEVISFHIATNFAVGRTERSKEFTLATEGEGRWTITRFRTYSTGGPDLVTEWSVVRHSSKPPEVALLDTFDSVLPWVWAGTGVIMIGFGALIFWLVRRSRRRHDPWAGRP
jgi:hypothetical protein